MTNIASLQNDIWEDDLLGRKQVSTFLSGYLNNRFAARPAERGFVLAVNAEWGFGKTYLLKNWCAEIAVNYPAVYFDAWQNDFTPEPLIAFIAELDVALTPYFKNVAVGERASASIKGSAAAVWNQAKAAILPLLAKKALNMSLDEVAELFDTSALIEAQTDESGAAISQVELQALLKKAFTSTLKNHSDIKSAITSFKKKLELLIGSLDADPNINLPIFIFIDELDRCRPSYAIELLEGVKHLFGVPGIYFIVSTNIAQMGESVKAIYGSGFDGQQYLKRFFDLEYSLPEPDNESFAKALFKDLALPKIIFGPRDIADSKMADAPSYIFSIYADFFGAGLRDQQQVIRLVEAAFLTCDKAVHIHYLYFLAFLYQASVPVFNEIIRANSLIDSFQWLVKKGKNRPFESDIYQHGDVHRSSVTINAIAEMYFTASQQTIMVATRDYKNNHNFPRNMLATLREELPPQVFTNDVTLPSIKNYPEIIRHAGGFIGK